MNQPTHIGLYARPKVATEKMREGRWYAVFVECRQPDKPFVYDKDDEKIPIILDANDYSLEPVDHYRNPVVFIDELDTDSLESELRERLEERTSNRLEVRRNSGLNQRWMDVTWNDYEFSIPSEAISNPRPLSELVLETPDRVQGLLNAGAMIGVPLWVYDKSTLHGTLIDHFNDMAHCLIRPIGFDAYHAGSITITGGHTMSLDRTRHFLVPEQMEIKEGMWVMPRGCLSPEKVTMVCNDYIACSTATGRGVTYLETGVRLLTGEEEAEVEEALKPKPLTEDRAIELLGPTLHDMIMRYPGDMFTRGTIFQRIKFQVPKDADTSEKVMAFIMANPGELIESAKVWPVFDEGRTNRGWNAWINRVNGYAPPKPEITEPADHEHVFVKIKGKRSNLEIQKTRVTEIFEGEVEMPYSVFRKGAASISDWMHGVSFDMMKVLRENRRPVETYNDEDEEEFETLDFVMEPRLPEPEIQSLDSIRIEDLDVPPIYRPTNTTINATNAPVLGQVAMNADRQAQIRRGRALLDEMRAFDPAEPPEPIDPPAPVEPGFDRAIDAVRRLHEQIALAAGVPPEAAAPATEDRPTAREAPALERAIERIRQRARERDEAPRTPDGDGPF